MMEEPTWAETEPDFCTGLEERLRFETLLTEILARFVNLAAIQVDSEIEDAQRAICECLELDHCSLWQLSGEDADVYYLTHLYRAPELPPTPKYMSGSEFFPWAQRKLHAKEIVDVANTAAAPPEAARDKESWRQFGIRSTLGIPLSVGGGPVIGVLSFDATKQQRDLPEPLKKRLQLIAQVFANALDRKHAEQKLRESEARLSLAAASANAGLWTLEPDTGHIWATEKALELFGLSPNEEVSFDRFLSLVHPEDRDAVQRAVAEATQSGGEVSVDYRTVRPDQSVRWITSRGHLQPGRCGEPQRLMGVSIDVTESKSVEEELRQLKERLEAESVYLQKEVKTSGKFADMVGQSQELKKVFERMALVAPTNSVVLITGETGTGKELIARAIHNLSRRKDRVMVKVDCASLPASLIESELFGREKGAYTGALSKQIGRFELADGSTLFLDEVGELPLELQAKLLRVLQDGQFERLGNPKTMSVDVRVIAATHRDLSERVKKGSFREDLFYRLNVFRIHVPPLRERGEDIPLLVGAFLEEFEREMGKKIKSVTPESMRLLQAYSWPGNIRELRNVIEQAVILSRGGELDLQMPESVGPSPSPTLQQAQYHLILGVLQKTGWRIKGPVGAAQLLGMKPSTLYTTMQRLGIPTRQEKDGMPT
jgi:formate hydrogenlyase transcriptional activator